jgi:CxxC-x17-CxxC domain-containing protein
MTYADKNVTCRECGGEFLFTAFEQEFYALNNFTYEIECCRDCRRKQTITGPTTIRHVIPAPPTTRLLRDVSCFICGKMTAISFAPRFGRPVYCDDCYEQWGSRHAYR